MIEDTMADLLLCVTRILNLTVCDAVSGVEYVNAENTETQEQRKNSQHDINLLSPL